MEFKQKIFLQDSSSVLFIKTKTNSNEDFYAYIKPDRQSFDKIVNAHKTKEKIQTSDMGEILFFGYEKEPPIEIQELFKDV